MKNLILFISLGLLTTACETTQWGRIDTTPMQNLSNSWQQENQARNQQYNQPKRSADTRCVQQCRSQGYGFGYCERVCEN